ncbi:MAG: DegT/DnrJ/EryC1/StrS family aminotransferase [Candidatus Manganitrophus sp. SA1]|nr:DegT/DnrJ/EryC1/StrS family aminotransferase [Candidatus Manganitrophus morganii]
MKIQRTIPPAAAPLDWRDLGRGVTGLFSNRVSARRVEAEMKAYFGVKHLFLVSSGKAALTLILLALKSLSPKREVVIPAYTCFSVPSAVVKAGLDVALCDLDASTFDFDYRLLESAVNEKTLCVIPSHLFGIPSEMDRVNTICREKGVYVVEDAAQAMGGAYKGGKLGTLGDVGFFSLGRGKNITCGSGGIIVTNSDLIAEAIRRHDHGLEAPQMGETLGELLQLILMALFIRPVFYWFPAGLPFLKLGETFFHRDFPVKRLSGAKVGLLRNWRERLERSNQKRAETAAYFREHLQLKTSKKENIPYLRLPILMNRREERDRLYALSRKQGYGLSLMYPAPINEIEEIKDDFKGSDFPVAKKMAETLLALPTHPYLSERDKREICALLARESPSQDLGWAADCSIGNR